MGQDHEDVKKIEYRNQKEITLIYINSWFLLWRWFHNHVDAIFTMPVMANWRWCIM